MIQMYILTSLHNGIKSMSIAHSSAFHIRFSLCQKWLSLSWASVAERIQNKRYRKTSKWMQSVLQRKFECAAPNYEIKHGQKANILTTFLQNMHSRSTQTWTETNLERKWEHMKRNMGRPDDVSGNVKIETAISVIRNLSVEKSTSQMPREFPANYTGKGKTVSFLYRNRINMKHISNHIHLKKLQVFQQIIKR